MAATVKKQIKTNQTSKPSPELTKTATLFPVSFKTKCIILCSICFLFYANSLFNKYAMDDELTILSNHYVQAGISGIPKIMTSDSYASFYTDWGGDPKKQLSGGRYRPLSEIVFALEQQLFGDSEIMPYFRHFINVLAFMGCVLATFYFLEKFLFKKIPWGADIAFLTTFLFAIHPIHTEVVANIKSLDEILSILLIMLTFIYSLRYLKGKQTKHLLFGLGFYLLALLAKEYALTLMFFIPLMFYLLENKNPLEAIKSTIPYVGVCLVYLLLRYNAVGFHSSPPSSNVLVNPYHYATHMQRIATEWFVLGKYVWLLVIPYPLSCDYSYYQIAYHNLTDITVILSVLIYIAACVWGVMLLLKKNILSFAVFFFLLNVFMVSNFVLDIGATMGERLVFHSSLGFLIILCCYLFKAIAKMPLKTKKSIVIGGMSVLGVVCFGETVVRNAQWKDDGTLFIHDAGVATNSFQTNLNASGAYLKLSEKKENTEAQAKAYLDSVRKYANRALHFFPNLDAAYNKLGGMYLHLGMLDSAEYYWDTTAKLHPTYPVLKSNFALLSQLYFQKGIALGQNGNIREGLVYMKKAARHDSLNATIWYNIGGAYFSIQNYDSAYYAWKKTLQIDPNNADAQRGMQAISSVKKN